MFSEYAKHELGGCFKHLWKIAIAFVLITDVLFNWIGCFRFVGGCMGCQYYEEVNVVNTSDIIEPILDKIDDVFVEGECDPYYDESGCYLDIFIPEKDLSLGQTTITNSIHGNRGFTDLRINGNIMVSSSLNPNSKPPYFIKLGTNNSPYEASSHEGRLLFRGDLEDYKSDDKLGWFNEDKFKIDKSSDCKKGAYTYCRDSSAIEIFSFDYEVIFSVDAIGRSLVFSGVYKDESSKNFHIYRNQNEIITNELEKAIIQVDSIKSIFNFRTRDSLNNCLRII